MTLTFRKRWAVTLCIWTALNFSIIFSEENYPVDVDGNLESISQNTPPPSCPNDQNILSLIQTVNECSEESPKESSTESNNLSIKPTPTFTTEYIAAAEYTPSTTAEVYPTIATINTTFKRINKKRSATTMDLSTTEKIDNTTPPDPILPTETISELSTSSIPELTSTIVPTIVASPTTEHTGITHTMTAPISIVSTTVIHDSFESNTSPVVVTVTPSLPSNFSTVVDV